MGIEAALFGQAALPWLTGEAAAASVTSGLIGSGGNLFGISGLTGSALWSGFSGASSLVGGVQSLISGNEQSDLAKTQAALAAAEQDRVSAREARLEGERVDEVLRRQKIAYLKSGVTLEGSPLLVMEETRRRGQDNIDEILRSGSASSSATLQEGRLRSKQLRGTGRSAFIGGITNAGKSFSSLFEAA